MSINSVSFRASNFEELIHQGQKYKAQTAAASGIKENKAEQGSGKGKKVVGGVLATAAIAAAVLGYVAKKKPECSLFQLKLGKYNVGETLKKAGEWIAKNAIKAKDNVVNLFKKKEEVVEATPKPDVKIPEAINEAGEAATDIIEGAAS